MAESLYRYLYILFCKIMRSGMEVSGTTFGTPHLSKFGIKQIESHGKMKWYGEKE